MKKIVFLPLLAASMSFAVTINTVKFEGLVHLSPQMAGEIGGLQVGKEFNYEVADKAIRKLFKQGYFNDIWIDEDNGNIVVHVEEKPTIALIEVEGVSEDDKKTIKDMLGLSKGMVYDKSAIKSAKDRISRYFEAKGYFDTVVEEDKSPLEELSSLKVTFKVNRGENIIIRKVELPGAHELDYGDIEPNIGNKEREFMGWMWGVNDGKLNLGALPTDSARIKDEYLAKGFLDANVSNPYLRVNYDDYDASLIYRINEGSQYRVDSIDVTSDSNISYLSDLKDDFRLEKGDIFNVKKLRKDMKTIETEVADKGYAFVRVYPQTKDDKQNHTVGINYVVNPGEKVNIRKVIIGGNSRTADSVIRRDIYLTAGDLYNRTSLNDTKDALKRTGYFEDVTIKEKRVSRNEVDLYVKVKETPTGAIRGGIGYGSSDGLLFDISVSDKNIFGSGLQGTANMSRSDDELSGRIGITNPRVYDSLYSLGGSIYAEDNDWDSYDERTYGASITTGRRIGRYAHASLQYVLEQNNLSNLNDSLIERGYKEGKSIKSALIPAISFNNTDDYYLPRRGIKASTSLEYAGLGGDEEFIKSINKFAIYYGLADLTDWDVILRYKARFRWVWDEGYLPVNERLYLGGIGSVRGYDSHSIGPKTASGYEYGGTKSFNNSVEASFPLIDRLKMRAAIFYDYGMIGTDAIDDYTRSSAGVAIEWISPLGPINLIFAQPLDDEKGDDTSSFEFTIGAQF